MITRLRGDKGRVWFRNEIVGDVIFWDLERETHRIETFGRGSSEVFLRWIGTARLINVKLFNFSLEFFLKEESELYLETQDLVNGLFKILPDRLILDTEEGFLDIEFEISKDSVWKLEQLELK